MVIEAAVKELDWSPAAGDLKTIFIAGNEPFTQGPVDYPIACKAAVARGITVNTIHCAIGNSSESADWRKGALLADGGFTVIDQDQRAVHIAAPQDAELERLGVDLNRTYVPFGSLGASRSANQMAQDSNAKAAAPGAEVQRAVAKSSAFYKNSAWDLVDATKEGQVVATNPGRVISREELLSRIWHINPDAVETRTVDMHVARLRDKLRDDPDNPRIIVTIRGRGYVFEAIG